MENLNVYPQVSLYVENDPDRMLWVRINQNQHALAHARGRANLSRRDYTLFYRLAYLPYADGSSLELEKRMMYRVNEHGVSVLVWVCYVVYHVGKNHQRYNYSYENFAKAFNAFYIRCNKKAYKMNIVNYQSKKYCDIRVMATSSLTALFDADNRNEILTPKMEVL